MLPPGDIRRCLVAMARTENLMDQVFQHRFAEGKGIKGHNLGNLLIAALTDITGDFIKAIAEVSKVLAVQGQVLPATLQLVVLGATMTDGTVVMGETAITAAGKQIKEVFRIRPIAGPCLKPRSIREADAIVLGPGSLFTSIIPNSWFRRLEGCVKPGRSAFCSQHHDQPGETTGFTATDHLDAVARHLGPATSTMWWSMIPRLTRNGSPAIGWRMRNRSGLTCGSWLSEVKYRGCFWAGRCGLDSEALAGL